MFISKVKKGQVTVPKDGIMIIIPDDEINEEGKVSSTGKTALHYYGKQKVKAGENLRSLTVNYSSPLKSDADVVSL